MTAFLITTGREVNGKGDGTLRDAYKNNNPNPKPNLALMKREINETKR